MKHKIALVGAGGIGCSLAPMLSRYADLVIVDGDQYTPENAARQFPALEVTGNKSLILASHISRYTLNSVLHISSYFKGPEIFCNPETQGLTMIIGAVDNNASRRIIVETAEIYGLPAIIAGNEHKSGEAYLFIPNVFNPFDHVEFPDTDPAPWACNAPETLDAHPQTAIANQLAAAAAIHLFLSYTNTKNPENTLVYSKLDTHYSEYKRARDYMTT